MANKDIKYINKDFTDLKSALIEYAKAYYPTAYTDFTTASPGSMFIDMAAYVGDILSFYLDNQIQETFLQYAKQPKNLYTMAYMLGYRPKTTSAATVALDVYQLIPAKVVGGNYVPDYDYALLIKDGMQVSGNSGAQSSFYVPESINFAVSGSTSPTEVTIYSTDISGNPDWFLLKKQVQAISGTVKSQAFSFGTATKFNSITISDTNVIEIINVTDSDGNKWYEVPYLAQDTILEAVANLEGVIPNYSAANQQVPYYLQTRKVPRRFVTRVKPDNTVELQFGAGINLVADEAVVPMVDKTGIGLLDSLTKLNTAYDPTNFTTTYTYGLAPGNTTLTVNYLIGGGASANAPANTVTYVGSKVTEFFAGTVGSAPLGQTVIDSVTVNNPGPAVGGGDGDTVDEVKLNTLLQFPTQLRAVTQQDYVAFAYSMPAKFGQVAKAYLVKDLITYDNITQGVPGVSDPSSISIYVLGYDSNRNLAVPSLTLKENLKTYLSEYRMLTDTVNIRDGYIINIGINFEVILRPSYAGREVIAECITSLKTLFNTDLWQINQPIVLSNVYNTLDKVTGVQTVKKVQIINKYGEDMGYSKYAYDISAATSNGVIYPSLDPSIFEVKYPDVDIRGRVVVY